MRRLHFHSFFKLYPIQIKQLAHSFNLKPREWNYMVEKVVLCVGITLKKAFIINAACHSWFAVLKCFWGEYFRISFRVFT